MKAFFILAVLATRPFTAAASQPCDVWDELWLPLECKDFELVMGNPFKAQIILIGEAHYVCDEEKRACTKALLNERTRLIKDEKAVLLFEGSSHNERIECEDYGFSTSGDCRGWNTESQYHAKVKEFYWKHAEIIKIFQHLQEKFVELGRKPKDVRVPEAIAVLENFIQSHKHNLKKYKKEYAEFMKAYGGTKSDIRSKTELNLAAAKFGLREVKKFLKLFKETESLHEVVQSAVNQANDYMNFINKYVLDTEASTRDPNKAMVKAISKVTDKNHVIFVYAGEKHVNKNYNRKSDRRMRFTEKDKEIIQELYDELNKFSDENPFAVLSCTL